MVSDFGLYNNFSMPVIVLDGSAKVVFKNIPFVKMFGGIKTFEKFSNYFSFDIGFLNSDNILSSNPVSFAIESKESFTANATYQKADKLRSFKIKSFFENGFKVLLFEDITTDILYEEAQKKYSFIRQQYLDLVEENKKFANLQQQSQAQTVKLGLLHRISSVVRESIDLNKIITSALKELFNLFGAIKVYYAEFKDDKYEIKHVFPTEYESILGEVAEFSADTQNSIRSRKIKINACIKEYLNSQITYPAQVSRIIVPVSKVRDILGILMIYTNKKNFDESQNDVLQSIATQMASAIVQGSLFSQVKQKNEELENTLRELKETQLQLINSEKMASLGQLVAGVAHEINTPLASINSNNEILTKLLKKISDNPDENTAKMLFENIENINKIDKEAIKRISQIVKSLKKFVRLDESDLQEADINKELDLTLEIIKHETKNKIEIVKNYAQLPMLKCYPNMLNQVFMNLLINACHSMPDGGKITLTTRKNGDNLLVSVKDTGFGIDEKIKDRIFVAGITTKQIGIGTGLGLAISKKIVEKHNGKIYFETATGVGTEFFVEIPFA